jgi:drug/metabolite transporter (DMT)-like permease
VIGADSALAKQTVPPQRPPMKEYQRSGLIYAVAGFATLSVGDAVVKSMAGAWPAFAVAALRFSLGAMGLALLLLRSEGPRAFIPSHPWLQVARGICLAIASVSFFSAIYLMPLAEAMAIAFLSPVLTQLLAGPVLGETVHRRVWIASAAAFAGVLIILRPNLTELGVAALLPLNSALFMALLMICNRASAGQGSALSMQVFMAAICAPILIVGAAAAKVIGIQTLDFGWPSPDVVLRCAIVAVTASTAHWLVYIGAARAGAAAIAPATYVQMLVAITLGWWWFGDRPDGVTLAGAALIVGSGLYLWHASARGALPIESE